MLGQQQQHQHSERRSGSRRRRRGRSGEGIVKANRKTEICLHWRNGSCPYGAGSCAFAHGLGELRHPTMDDDTIIDSVSEDSGSCPPSPRDPSPSRRPRQHSRDRRLPTFVHLSAGNTPEVRPFAALSSTPATSHGSGVLHESHRGRQRERSHPWPSSSDDDVHVRSALIEPPTPAPISTAGAQFPEGGWGAHPGRNLSTSTAGRPMSEMFTTAYGGCIEDRHHRTPSATSHATPNPFRQPLMVHPSQKPQQAGWGEGGAPVGPTSQHQRTFPHPGAGRSAWW